MTQTETTRPWAIPSTVMLLRSPSDGMQAPQGLGKVTGVSYFLYSAGGLPLRPERLLGREAFRRGQEALQEEGPRMRAVQAAQVGSFQPLVSERTAAPSPVRADPSPCRRLGQPVNRATVRITQSGAVTSQRGGG